MKKKNYLILTIFVILVLILGGTYAYVRIVVTGTKTNLLSSGTLSLRLLEDSNSISIPNAIPMKPEDGKAQDPFTFSLENNGTVQSYYTVYLVDDAISSGGVRLEDKYVDYYLTKTVNGNKTEQINLLTYMDTDLVMINGNQVTGRVIDSGLIQVGTSNKIDYSLRLWLDYSAGNDAMNKEFAAKLYVVADQVREKVVINGDGTNANVPEVADGMIPVVYNGDNWVKADITNANKSWFDYSTQKWANVVTVLENGTQSRLHYESAPNGTVIPMADINTMWVWIPRYSYTIKSEDGTNYYGKGSTNKNLPGEIDIKFISVTEKETGTAQYTGSTASNYLTMPGFTFGNEELSGIWVGKFETAGGTGNATTTAENVLIKPDVQSWRNIQVSKMYLVGRDLQNQESIFGFSNSTNDLDSHMMKNTEWSLVAFLSQSKYGKYGNTSYTGAEKEVFINNSSGYYTGRSGGSYGGNTPINGTYTSQGDATQYKNYGFYSYDDYLLDYSTGAKTTKVAGKGTGASTTGNIYGVYDMSGGAWECVMANHQNYSGYTARSYTIEEAQAVLGRTDGTAAGIWNSGFNGPVFGKDYNEETGAWDIPMSITNGTPFPESKYYDLYQTTSYLTACNGGPCKGQSYETSSWYGDTWWFGALSNPWVGRGGYCANGSGAGVFYSYAGHGNVLSDRSFRLVLVVSN